MRLFLPFASVFFAVCCLGQQDHAEPIPNDASFSHRFFISAETALQYHVLNTSVSSADFNLTHKWHYLPPKLTLRFGWQCGSKQQWMLGMSYMQLPNTFITSRHEENPGNYTIRNREFTVGAKTDNYQLFLAFKHYLDPETKTYYFGFRAGSSFSFYSYQKTCDETLTNANSNTFERNYTIYPPRKGKAIHPFISAGFGKSFQLGNRTTLDAGLRTSCFFGSRKDFTVNMNELKAVENNLSRANLRSLNSLHLIELYASFSLFL